MGEVESGGRPRASSSCARKHATPVSTSSLITCGGDLASCMPSIHSVTSTLRVVKRRSQRGTCTLPPRRGTSSRAKRSPLAASLR